MASTMRRSDGALQRLLSDPALRTPLLRRAACRLAALVLTALLLLPLSSCTFPQDEEDVPEKEWVVESVLYYPNSIPAVVAINVTGDHSLGHYSYYKDFNLSEKLEFSSLISIIGISDLQFGYLLSSRIDLYIQGSVLPPGTVVTFSDTAFYQVDTESIYGDTVVGKVRIVTPSMEITVIE